MPRQSEKVVVVTGSSSGIGAAVAREAARQGYPLLLTARRADRLEALANELRLLEVDVLVVPADLADPETPERLVAAALERFGRLDVLINNAAVGVPHLFSRADPDGIRYQLQVNFVAPIMLTRYALPHLLESKGTVINVGSAITFVANSALGAYGATKAGLAYWNDALRRELRHRGVRVCLVEPGPVASEFFDAMGMFGRQGTGVYNPLRDPPPPLMNSDTEAAARRIVKLITSPRRRITLCRRVVWPHRMAGSLFHFIPWLGDVAMTSMIRHLERTAFQPDYKSRRPDDVRAHR
ncbi:MAG TPA: SDR family NAD(P)-dependent oxidoreductase [Isosphaeraceae bacterium]|nr:SDR family NAD(P)-dependent oxidoreductase [Isosphaeraceae bacterium]